MLPNSAEHPVVPQFWSSSGSNMVVLLTLVIILIVPSALILGVYVIYRWSAARRASQWRRCNIPFSPPTFPLGHDAFSCLTSASPLVAFDRIYRENADEDLVGFFATSCPFILIRDPRLIQRLLAFWAQVHFPSLQIFESFRFTSQKSKHAMGKFLRRKMDHRMAHGNCGDFVDLMKRMQSKTCWNAQSTSTLDLEDEGLNMRQMIGLSFVLLVAGTDAVASVCHLTLHLLSLYPEHQKKVQQEIDQGMAKHGVSELTLSVVQDLQFLEQCLMETLRLYPSLFAIVRTCTEDFHISGTRYKFRKGDKLMIIPYSINRDPKYFKNPDDFEPDRFSPENRGSMPPETFLTFGIGPRKCPGYRIGLHIAATFVASLLCKYTLKPCSHLRQLGAADFDPLWFSLQYAKNSILIDFVPRVVNPMTTEH
ncbi:unnamed protein product [Bemisia tabaci]|uniref:Cytochrome P450 n=1 Tax=Bemisia tabaci TaxID=7038 RepID=A0A9P0C8F4_BEMTA|nr:unnamed protein product [Bemisia tabaci]